MRHAKSALVIGLFTVVALGAATGFSIMAGGGYSRATSNNMDPRSVQVEVLLVSFPSDLAAAAVASSEARSSQFVTALLRNRSPVSDDPSDFDDLVSLASQIEGISADIEIHRASVLVQHEEQGTIEITRQGANWTLSASPTVLEKDVMRVAIDLATVGRDLRIEDSGPIESTNLHTTYTARSGAVLHTLQGIGENPNLLLAIRTTLYENKG